MRETGPVRKDLNDVNALPYIGAARTLLGVLKMRMGGLPQGSMTRLLPDGTMIRVGSVFGHDRISIIPATAAAAVDAVVQVPAVAQAPNVGVTQVVEEPATAQDYLEWWLDASKPGSIIEDGGVGAWLDGGPNGYDGEQSDPALRGTLSFNHFGPGAVRFTGMQGLAIANSPVTISGGKTLYMVLWWNEGIADSYSQICLCGGNDISTGVDMVGMFSALASPTTDAFEVSDIYDTGTYFWTGDGAPILSGKLLFEVVINDAAASTKLTTNIAGLTVSYVSNVPWEVDVTQISGQVGIYDGAGNELAEVRLYSSGLSEAKRASIREELIAKWGL